MSVEVITLYPNDIGYSSVTLIGYLHDFTDRVETECYFQYTDDPTFEANVINTPVQVLNTGTSFSQFVKNLDHAKKYYFRAVAIARLTWDKLDALDLTWGELDSLDLTWDEFDDYFAEKSFGEIIEIEFAATNAKEFSATLQSAASCQAQLKVGHVLSAMLRGAAMATATTLILRIPEGVYNIDADNIFDRNQPITPDSLANYIEVWVNPLKPVAEPEEVYKTDEEDPFLIDANETKTVTIHYKKEPVTEVNIEFVNAPPYATIDSIKHYAWGADVTVTSPEAGTFELVATGKPLEVQGRELVVREDETSILENGVKKYTFDNPFVQDRATAEMIAEKLLAFAVPQADIEIDWRGDPALVLADPVLIPTFQRQGLDQRGVFYVTKQELEYDGGLRAKLSGRKMEGGNG